MEPRLRALARREIVALDTDPQSPERGQWGFTQALIREVAYATLSKKERRAQHIAAARYFESLEDEETSGMLATHYLDAYLASPDGPEADVLAAQARVALRAAADRAAALGSHEQAIAYLRRALEAAPGRSGRCRAPERDRTRGVLRRPPRTMQRPRRSGRRRPPRRSATPLGRSGRLPGRARRSSRSSRRPRRSPSWCRQSNGRPSSVTMPRRSCSRRNWHAPIRSTRSWFWPWNGRIARWYRGASG